MKHVELFPLWRRVGSGVKAPTRHRKKHNCLTSATLGLIVFGLSCPGSWATPEGHVGQEGSSIQLQSVFSSVYFILYDFLQQRRRFDRAVSNGI